MPSSTPSIEPDVHRLDNLPTPASLPATSATSPNQQRVSRASRPGKELAPPRKKACKQCSGAKVRCDLRRPSCSRCRTRRLPCKYTRREHGQEGDDGIVNAETVGVNGAAQPGDSIHLVVNDGLESNTIASAYEPNTSLSGGTQQSSVVVGVTSPPVAQEMKNQYDTATTTSDAQARSFQGSALTPSSFSTVSPQFTSFTYPRTHDRQQNSATQALEENSATTSLDLSVAELVCTVDSSRVRNRWLGEFLPFPDQRPKSYPPGIVHYVSRVLKTYPALMARGDGNLPPIVHPAQMVNLPTPLANCLVLTRMWENQVVGGQVIVRQTVLREMERLFEERESYNQVTLLAAFQAYLLYAMMMFFSDYPRSTFTPLSSSSTATISPTTTAFTSDLITRSTMINLQELAHDLTLTGLMCATELLLSTTTTAAQTPDLPSWILAATKRRTLLTMYMFDSVYCNIAGLPSFIAEELAGLPAPESKSLWAASCAAASTLSRSSELKWRREYMAFLADWGPEGGGLRVEELWPLKEGVGNEGRELKDQRVARWVRDVDEFGMFLFGVTGVTHRC